VGSARVERVDVRIVACTNRNLAAEASAGRFREDLYYRLAVIDLVVPALRERREDIPALAEEFARRYAERFGVEGARLSPELVERLQRAEWPGNVRELENAIARLVALSTGGEIGLDALETGADEAVEPAAAEPASEEPGELGGGPSLREQVEAFERGLIARALASAHGNQSEAARRLRTNRATLIDKLKKYGLSG
jgi:two-component system response regulator AtoC